MPPDPNAPLSDAPSPPLLVKVRHAGQITLPTGLRQRFALHAGSYLEAIAIESGILLKPVTMVERAHSWHQPCEETPYDKETAPIAARTTQSDR